MVETPPSTVGRARGRAPGEAPPGRRRSRTVLRGLLTAVLLGWILVAVDWRGFVVHLGAANLWILALTVLLRPVGPVICAYRWQILLKVHGVHYPLRLLARWYITSISLSQFLPTNIGGDAYRIYRTLGNTRSRSRAVSSVFVERITGILGLAAMGYVAAVLIYLQSRHPVAEALLLIGSAGLVAGLALMLALGQAARLPRLRRHRWFAAAATRLRPLIEELRQEPAAVATTLLLSVAFHLSRIGVLWLTLYAVGEPISLTALVAISTAVEAAALLPLTPGGLGVVEGSLIFLLGQFGVSAEAALATAVLARVLLVPLHLLGLAFYFAEERTRRASATAQPSPSSASSS